ncbi:MAG TPA: hypothetical protein VKK79_23535 [Candidatus Lokiarchaeia archaeon]|nr:hypothetical protein [Candidatus Lokiarchaeia archaeon]
MEEMPYWKQEIKKVGVNRLIRTGGSTEKKMHSRNAAQEHPPPQEWCKTAFIENLPRRWNPHKE